MTEFPVYLYESGMELPTEGTYYLVSGNGLWLHKDTGVVKAFVPVQSVAVLEDLDAQEFVECHLPSLPLELVWKVKEFFRRVVEVHRSEAEVTLYYRKSDESYKIHVPPQQVSHGGVRYQRVGMTHIEGMEDYLRVGTIHSHCDFGAFHSGTDVGDEIDFDGIHVTFGHNDKEVFTISASVVVNGLRNKVIPDFLEGVVHDNGEYYKIEGVTDEQKADWSLAVDAWMGQVNSSSESQILSEATPKPTLENSSLIERGNWVEWAGDLKLVSLRDSHGDGPFKVIEKTLNKITVFTSLGPVEFDSKLFKKVNDEDSQD